MYIFLGVRGINFSAWYTLSVGVVGAGIVFTHARSSQVDKGLHLLSTRTTQLG